MESALGGIVVLLLVLAFCAKWFLRSILPDEEEAAAAEYATPRQPARRSRDSALIPAGFDYWLEYADAFGVITERPIRFISLTMEPATGIIYIHAFCGLRGEDRTFRAERILSLRGVGGDPIACPVQHFRGHWALRRQPATVSAAGRAEEKKPGLFGASLMMKDDPDKPKPPALPRDHEKVMLRARSGLRGLIWLAAADGEISDPEMGVLLGWISFRARPGEEWSRDAAVFWIREARPTLAAARTGLLQMGKAETVRFLAMTEDLMQADGAKCRLEEGRARRLRAACQA